MPRENEHSVMVSELPRGATGDELKSLFSNMGFRTITDVYLPARKAFGFVRFSNADDAEECASLNRQVKLRGSELRLEVSIGNKRRPPELMRTSGPATNPMSLIGRGGRSGRGNAEMTSEPMRPAKKPAEYSIWVGNLPQSTSADDLREAFQSCAITTMTDVYLPPGKGFGFVRFATPEDAECAMTEVQGLKMRGIELEFKVADAEKRKGGPPQDGFQSFGPSYDVAGMQAPAADGTKKAPEYSLWVGNLPSRATTDELRSAFLSRGVEAITDVYIPPGKDFGFVRFATPEDVDNALPLVHGLNMHGTDLHFKASITEKRRVGLPPGHQPTMGYGGGCMGDYGPAGGWMGEYGAGEYGPSWLPSAKVSSRGGAAPATERQRNKPPEFSVKVSNFQRGTGADELRQIFIDEGIDSMTDVYIPTGRNFGFLRFARLSEAQQALGCSGLMVGNSEITCEMAEGDKKTSQDMAMASVGRGFESRVAYHTDADAFQSAATGKTGEISIKFSGLPSDATPEEVIEAFAEQGIDSMTDCYIPGGKRFGFVRFASLAEGRHAIQRPIALRGMRLDLEIAVGNKRKPQEMLAEEAARSRGSTVREAHGPMKSAWDVPENPNVSEDTPSVKVTGVPPGTGSDQLHKALIACGLRGSVNDVYIPRGDRGFGFVRFNNYEDAEDLTRIQASIHGVPLTLEMAVSARKGKREASPAPVAAGLYGPGSFAGYGPNGPSMSAKGGWGPMAKGWGGCGGKYGPYGGKGLGW